MLGTNTRLLPLAVMCQEGLASSTREQGSLGRVFKPLLRGLSVLPPPISPRLPRATELADCRISGSWCRDSAPRSLWLGLAWIDLL